MTRSPKTEPVLYSLCSPRFQIQTVTSRYLESSATWHQTLSGAMPCFKKPIKRGYQFVGDGDHPAPVLQSQPLRRASVLPLISLESADSPDYVECVSKNISHLFASSAGYQVKFFLLTSVNFPVTYLCKILVTSV